MKTMPKSTKEEKLRWIRPILEGSVLIKNMAQVCPFSLRSLNYWLRSYRAYGPEGLENKSTRPRTNPKETPIRIKERIIELRKKRKGGEKNILILPAPGAPVCGGERRGPRPPPPIPQ